MSRRDLQRLEDIGAACAAIAEHLTHGDLAQGLVFDAVRVRLIEIGEAVKALDAELLATEGEIPWRQIGRMRDQLAHRYFDTSHAHRRRHRATRSSPARGRHRPAHDPSPRRRTRGLNGHAMTAARCRTSRTARDTGLLRAGRRAGLVSGVPRRLAC